MKNKSPEEIADIFEHFTSYRLSRKEAVMIHETMQPGYYPYPGDFIEMPQAQLGRALAHSKYGKNDRGVYVAEVRRGNVGFTSTNHTAEDQFLLAYGAKARDLGLGRHVDNTYLFKVMCRVLGGFPRESFHDGGRGAPPDQKPPRRPSGDVTCGCMSPERSAEKPHGQPGLYEANVIDSYR